MAERQNFREEIGVYTRSPSTPGERFNQNLSRTKIGEVMRYVPPRNRHSEPAEAAGGPLSAAHNHHRFFILAESPASMAQCMHPRQRATTWNPIRPTIKGGQ